MKQEELTRIRSPDTDRDHAGDAPQCMIDAATALRRENLFAESVQLLTSAHHRFPDAIAVMHELAVSLRLAGDCEESLAICEKALEKNPSHRPALRARIDTNIHFNRSEDALAAIEDAGDFLDDDTAIQIKKGRLLQQLGRFDDGAESLRAYLDRIAPEAPRRTEIELELARALQGAGKYYESLGIANAVLEGKPGNPNAWLRVIDTHDHFLQVENALRAADKALAAIPGCEALLIRKVALLRKAGWLTESDQLLRDISEDTPPLQLARLEGDIALGRIDTAIPALRTRWEQGDTTVTIALDLIKALRLAGDRRQARTFAETAVATLPNAPALRAVLLDMCLEMRDHEGLDKVLGDLPQDMRSAPAIRHARARIALINEDFETAAGVHLDAAENIAVPAAELDAALAVPRSVPIDRDMAQSVLRRLNDLLDRKAAILPAVTISMLRAKILAAVGDWSALHPLAAALEREQPRNLGLTLLRARAAFELARFDEAETAVARVLENNPVNGTAIRLHNALLQLRGEIDRYFEINIERTENPAAMSEVDYIELVKNMFLAGRNARAADLLRHVPPHFQESERIGFQKQLLTGNPQAAARGAEQGAPQPMPKALSREKLERLLDLDDETALAGNALIPALWIAWMMRRDRQDRFETWRRIALNADNVAEIIRRNPRFTGPPQQLRLEIDYGALTARMRDRLPTLIVTSHSGPAMLPFLVEQYESIRYFIQPIQKDWAVVTEGLAIHFTGQKNDTAVEIVRNLRQGNTVYSLPDLPVGTIKMHDPNTLAVGTLFGMPYAILDTIPKVSRAMKIPSFWVQPLWREGKIHIDVMQLPMAERDEPEDAWCARWAQSYLDKVAAVLTSGPENLSLRIPIWRYFLLNGLGPEALRYARKTVAREAQVHGQPARWIARMKAWVHGLNIYK